MTAWGWLWHHCFTFLDYFSFPPFCYIFSLMHTEFTKSFSHLFRTSYNIRKKQKCWAYGKRKWQLSRQVSIMSQSFPDWQKEKHQALLWFFLICANNHKLDTWPKLEPSKPFSRVFVMLTVDLIHGGWKTAFLVCHMEDPQWKTLIEESWQN